MVLAEHKNYQIYRCQITLMCIVLSITNNLILQVWAVSPPLSPPTRSSRSRILLWSDFSRMCSWAMLCSVSWFSRNISSKPTLQVPRERSSVFGRSGSDSIRRRRPEMRQFADVLSSTNIEERRGLSLRYCENIWWVYRRESTYCQPLRKRTFEIKYHRYIEYNKIFSKF